LVNPTRAFYYKLGFSIPIAYFLVAVRITTTLEMSRKQILDRKVMSQPIRLTQKQINMVNANRQAALQRLAKNQKSVYLSAPRRYDNIVRRATPQEVNYVELAGNSQMNTTGAISLLATIPQGAGVSQRIGKRAYYKSIMARLIITAGTTNVTNICTYMIVYDKRPTGALPAITDILQTVTPLSNMNDNNTGRFEIIRRESFQQNGNSTTAQTGQERIFYEDYINLAKRPVVFESAGTGTIGDIDSGALYLILLSTNNIGTTASTCDFTFRTRYTEQ